MDDLDIIKNAYSIPDLYERLYEEVDDIDFYFNLIKDYKIKDFLELGCGTGRVSFSILLKAKEKLNFTGVDISSDMINTFKNKLNKVDKNVVNLIEDDIRSFDLEKQFPMIIMPNNSFSHMTDDLSVENCLLNVKKHLKPNGVFVFSIFFPNNKALSKDKDNVYYVSSVEDKNGSVSIYESLDYDPCTQINDVSWYFCRENLEPGDEDEEGMIKKTFKIRMFFHQEIKYILKYYGFKIVNVYGDYDKGPIDKNSINQIFVVRAEGS